MRSSSMLNGSSLRFEQLLELLDRSMDQHFGGTVRFAQGPCYFPVVHTQRESHDESFPTIVRQLLKVLYDSPKFLSPLDQILG